MKSFKLQHFDSLKAESAVEHWQKYLQSQVEAFFPEEYRLLKARGFDSKIKKVLDFGCGAGLFTRALRVMRKDLSVLAVDANEKMLESLWRSLVRYPDRKIMPKHWILGEEAAPQGVKDCQAVVLRYVLQHTKDPKSILINLRKHLKKGTLLFIIEEDDELYKMYPDIAVMRKLLSRFKKWGEKYGTNTTMGPLIPRLLSESGYKVQSCDVLCHTATNLGLKPLLDYYRLSLAILSSTAPDILSPKDAEDMNKDFLKAMKSNEEFFLFYPQIITVGKVS